MISEIGGYYNTQGNAGRNTSGVMDKDDFLKLLLTQLRYQDPLSPMEGTEFAAQLAQFSSLEQLSNINTSLEYSIEANFLLSQSINNALSATFIGKEVRAVSNSFMYSGDGDMTLGYTLNGTAGSVTVKIYDETGSLVRTIKPGELDMSRGDNTITWNGRDDNGRKVGEGRYTFSVEATSTDGTQLKAGTFIYGIVSGVRFKDTGSYFTVNGIEIPLAFIEEIREGE